MKPDIGQIEKSIKSYRHKLKARVKFHEVDSFRVVHNLRYFYWLEWARMEYFRNLGTGLEFKDLLAELPVMTVIADIDYFNPCTFDDEYEILTSITEIGESSLRFENIIRKTDGLLVCRASAVIVHLDKITREPAPVPDNFRNKILDFEKDNIKIIHTK